ncbi:MerR family transcriptional regulator [Enterococcus sp. LJL128]
MFKIGEFSKISNITVRTLRHYEKLGLLIPSEVDPYSGYRYYKAEQLSKINQIKLLQQVGLSLESIKEILEKQQMDVLNYYYEIREQELNQEIDALNRKKNLINELQKQLKVGTNMEKYNVVLKTIPARTVASVRKVMSNFEEEGRLWGILGAEMQKQGVIPLPGSLPTSLYHDKEYRETDVDVEVQVAVAAGRQDTDEIKFYDASEVTIASVTFNGSFEQMPQVTQAIAVWIETNQYKVSGPMINRSHVSPGQDPNPENWITEASFVVEPIQ